MTRPIPATAAQIGSGEDRLVDIHSPEVPAGIRSRVLQQMQPGDQLWCCPRRGPRRGLPGLGQPTVMIEWWLVDARGELIEAFWEEA